MLSTFFQFLSRILARTFHPAIEIISCFTLREREGLPARSHEPIDRSRRADVPVIDSSRREVEETLKEGLRSARQSLLIYHLVAAGSSLAFSIETPRGLVPVLPVNAIKSANGIAANGRSVIIQLRGTIYRHNSNLSKVDPLPPSPARKTDPNFRDKQQQCDCTRTSSAILPPTIASGNSTDHHMRTSFKRTDRSLTYAGSLRRPQDFVHSKLASLRMSSVWEMFSLWINLLSYDIGFRFWFSENTLYLQENLVASIAFDWIV